LPSGILTRSHTPEKKIPISYQRHESCWNADFGAYIVSPAKKFPRACWGYLGAFYGAQTFPRSVPVGSQIPENIPAPPEAETCRISHCLTTSRPCCSMTTTHRRRHTKQFYEFGQAYKTVLGKLSTRSIPNSTRAGNRTWVLHPYKTTSSLKYDILLLLFYQG